MMSRRKQSNPKSIKHDGDEDTPDKCGVREGDIETDSNEHSPVNSEASPERHTGGIWSPESGDTLTDQGTCGYDNMDESECQDGHSVTSEDLKEEPGTELGNRSPASDQRSSKSPDCARTSKCDLPEQSPDTGKEDDDVQSIVIKTEPPSSPSSVVNDSESRDAVYPQNISASFATLNGSRAHRRRRRSRSRSKSGGVPASPEATSTLTQTREEAERALVNRLQLPSDVLYFRQQEMNIHGTPSVSWVVCCAIPLPQGSSLGPFQGQLVPPESVKVGDLIVQFTNKKGQQALMNVAGQSGGWLALLRSAGTGADRNTHVYWEGGRIWCEIISDIDIGTELRASFTFQNEDEGEDVDVEEDSLGSSIKDEVSGSEESSSNYSSLQQHSHQQTAAPGHAALIYGCPFCGVRFSSPRTLQGHLSFYCSKKTSEHSVTASPKVAEKKSNPGKTEDIVVKTEPDGSGDTVTSESKQDSGEAETHKDDLQKDRSTQGQITFKCKYCSYRADKLSSLNRHMRMHNNDKNKSLAVIPNIRSTEKEPKAKSDSKNLRIIKSPVLETFCKECKIQFSSLHTYKCHKEHYCAQRRKKALANPSAFEAMFHSPFSFAEAANVGIPSALQMAALNQGGLILPGAPGEANIPSGASVLVTAPMMTTNGMANITLSVPAMLVQSVVPGQDTRTPLTSPRIASTPEPKEALPSASHLSPRPQLLHFLSPPPPAFLKNDYSIRPEDLCRSKDSVTADNGTADIPLDLSVTKVKTESSNGGNKSEPKEIVSFLQPDKDGALNARSIKRFSSQSSTSPENKLKDLKDDSSSFNSRKSSLTTQRDESIDIKKETTPQHFLRSDHLSPGASQLLPHPSLLASAAAIGFIPLPGLTSLPISPKHPPPVASSSTSSISKCSDCNIVFYKYDNYLIHKKHYCSGKRRSVPAQASETLPVATDLPNQKEIHSKQSSPEIPTTNDAPGFQLTAKKSDIQASPSSKSSTDVKYKYYCVPCRIKFSNASILEAHKEYYCPAGKDSEQSVILQSSLNELNSVDSPKDERSVSPEPLHEEFSCQRCNSVFSSARLLRLHVCEGGFPCPHCDQVSITDNRLAEHMKIHAPTKAYRCTICGYRGNTARGMRMHGKTHIDEGLDFTDENMLEYHEPALVPVVHSSHSGSTTDSELLRLKNEPYKRRRSRKAYEKFDYPLPKVDVPQTCLLCGQNFPNVDYLTSHFKVHEIASQYVAGLMKCLNCEYIGKDPDDLRSHFELNHLSGSRNKQRRLSTQSTEDDLSNLSKDRMMPQKLMVLSDPNSSDDERSSESYDFKFKTKVKSEPMEEAMEEGEGNARDNVLDENNEDEGMDLQPSSNISTIHIKQEEPDVDLEVDDEEREPGELVNSLRIKKEVLDEEETYCTNSNSNMGNNMECEKVSAKENNVDSPKPESSVNLCGKSSSLKEDLLKTDEITRNRSPSPHSVVIKSERISPQSLSMTPNFLVNFSPNGTPASAGPATQSSPLTFSPFDPSPSTSSAVSPYHPHPLAFPYSAPPHMALPYVFLQPHLSTSPLPLGLKPSGREERLGAGARYCQNCDISFSKPSTYLAHKKYYCTARPRGESQPSAKA
ncbi:zinc finger protein ush [Biomphalaria pfeifferi]|uniref:Zinc finger protein ush n=1 Tax=Biomphalaria pfeifferi TaxID=112525 RepID=A0AAD8BVN6_BIOPF|nr:zinc finger protein ush [Biomphalaria pfeifferi]